MAPSELTVPSATARTTWETVAVYVVLTLVIIGVIMAIVLIAAGSTDTLGEAYPDRRYVELPAERALRPADLQGVRLAVGFRGYRMDEVDHLLNRLAYELELRDARIAELGPVPVGEPGGGPVSGDDAMPPRT